MYLRTFALIHFVITFPFLLNISIAMWSAIFVKPVAHVGFCQSEVKDARSWGRLAIERLVIIHLKSNAATDIKLSAKEPIKMTMK